MLLQPHAAAGAGSAHSASAHSPSHATPQAPQFEGSDEVSLHLPSQQVCSDEQTTPQPPQLNGSFEVSVQPDPQSLS